MRASVWMMMALWVLPACRDWESAFEESLVAGTHADGGSSSDGGGGAVGGGGGAVGGGVAGGGAVGGGGDTGGAGGGTSGAGGGTGGAGGGAGGGGGGAAEVDAGTWAHTGAGLFETAFVVEPGVWASGPNDAWAPAASGQLFQWDGLSWTRGSIGDGSGYCFSVWGYSPADVFIGCSFGAWFRSPLFTAHTAPGADDIHAIHGLSDGGSIYAVGSNWSLLRFESGDFVKVDAGVALSSSGAYHGFRTVAVVGEHDIWLGGAEGTIVRGDGTSWAVVDAGVSNEVYRIWANAPNDVWFVGLKAIVLHWNGMALERPAFCSTCGDIYTAWGHSAGDMWFGDGNGGLRHWDGTTLTHSIAPPRVKAVTGVFGVGDHDLFAIGVLANGNSGLVHFQR